MEKVCAYINKWRGAFGGNSIPISVNLSRMDIYRTDLCERLVGILEEYNVPTDAVHLEITESAYMDNAGMFLNTLSGLRKAGFKVEMDDFGSGYSSLNSLKDIDIDKLKLDMKFLSDTDNNRRGKIIISAVISMAEELGLPVIAEGVETKEQAEMLSDFGCNQMQGYYFSRPVPAEEYEKLLRAQAGK